MLIILFHAIVKFSLSVEIQIILSLLWSQYFLLTSALVFTVYQNYLQGLFFLLIHKVREKEAEGILCFLHYLPHALHFFVFS